jgi:hypothetical protein
MTLQHTFNGPNFKEKRCENVSSWLYGSGATVLLRPVSYCVQAATASAR